MINKIIFPLVAIIFLSSCANKFSLTKRKYTKGYYFASSKNNSSAKKETENKQFVVTNLTKKNTVLPAETIVEPEIKNTPAAEFLIVEKDVAGISKNKNSNTTIVASAKVKEPAIIKHHIKPVTDKQPVNSESKKGSADTNLIIMVILCFLWFFNLIAIYLHDGKKITLNFIITLLLDFTFVLGIIYSLLVVLDIVDLSK